MRSWVFGKRGTRFTHEDLISLVNQPTNTNTAVWLKILQQLAGRICENVQFVLEWDQSPLKVQTPRGRVLVAIVNHLSFYHASSCVSSATMKDATYRTARLSCVPGFRVTLRICGECLSRPPLWGGADGFHRSCRTAGTAEAAAGCWCLCKWRERFSFQSATWTLFVDVKPMNDYRCLCLFKTAPYPAVCLCVSAANLEIFFYFCVNMTTSHHSCVFSFIHVTN